MQKFLIGALLGLLATLALTMVIIAAAPYIAGGLILWGLWRLMVGSASRPAEHAPEGEPSTIELLPSTVREVKFDARDPSTW
jgi:pantothenate kinase type III